MVDEEAFALLALAQEGVVEGHGLKELQGSYLLGRPLAEVLMEYAFEVFGVARRLVSERPVRIGIDGGNVRISFRRAAGGGVFPVCDDLPVRVLVQLFEFQTFEGIAAQSFDAAERPHRILAQCDRSNSGAAVIAARILPDDDIGLSVACQIALVQGAAAAAGCREPAFI